MSLEDEVEWDPDLEDSANSSEIDDDLVLGAFAFYLECEKGKVPLNPGDSFCHCSQEFLQILIDDLLAIRELCITHDDLEHDDLEDLEHGGLNHERVEDCLASIDDELTRLDDHPELFSSKALRHQFFGFVYQIFQDWKEAFDEVKWMKWDDEDSVWLGNMLQQHHTRPESKEDRKPWQQFLHNKAPGSGFYTEEMNKGGCTQILPEAGVRISHCLSTECKEIIEELEAERDGSPLSRPGHPISLTRAGIAPSGLLRKCRRLLPTGRRLIMEPEEMLRETKGRKKVVKLERLNLDFWAFDAEANEQQLLGDGSSLLVHEHASLEAGMQDRRP